MRRGDVALRLGRQHPGIDRLRTQIGEAREVVLEHPICRRQDTPPDVSAGPPVPGVLTSASVPARAVQVVRTPGDILERAPLHHQAGAFAFGREDLIPEMVGRVDGQQQRPMAMQMLADARWAECSATTSTALRTRVPPADGIVAAVENVPRPS